MHWTKHIYNTILLRNPPLLATQLTTMMNLTPLRRVKKLRITTNMRIIVIEHQQLSHSHHSQLAPPQLQLILTKLCLVNWNMNRLSSGGWKLQCSHRTIVLIVVSFYSFSPDLLDQIVSGHPTGDTEDDTRATWSTWTLSSHVSILYRLLWTVAAANKVETDNNSNSQIIVIIIQPLNSFRQTNKWLIPKPLPFKIWFLM